MKANELRLGNWVHNSYGFGTNYRVYPQFFAQVAMGGEIDRELDNIVGIPLTEEWLERFGFFNEDGTGYVFESPKGISLSVSDDGVWYYMGNLEFLWVDILADIQYVHQLQNLYFALVGDELEIKEKAK